MLLGGDGMRRRVRGVRVAWALAWVAAPGWAEAAGPTACQEVPSGRIQGQVVDVLGQPVPFLRVCAVEGNYDDPDGSVDPSPRWNEEQRLGSSPPRSGGAIWRDGVTASNGEFEFEGLRPGEYVLRWAVDRWSENYTGRLGPEPVRTGGPDVRCVIERAGILVTWVDAEGQVLRGGGKGLAGSAPTHGPLVLGPPQVDAWSSPLTPFCNAALWGGPLPDGRWYFAATDGERYRASALGEFHRWEPRTIELGGLGAATPIRLRLPEALPSGEVRVTVTGPDGGELDDGYRVHIVDQASGVPVAGPAEVDWLRPRRSIAFRLPKGRYRAVADAQPEQAFCSPMGPRPWGRGVQEFEIVGAETTTLTLQLRAGARVDLELIGSIDGADLEAIRRRRHPQGHDPDRIWREEAALAGITLQRDGALPIPVPFRFGLDGEIGLEACTLYESHGFPLNRRGVSERIPAGGYDLVAELIGGRRVSCPVTLVDGETTRVRLRFRGD